jgi:hypothetical protein
MGSVYTKSDTADSVSLCKQEQRNIKLIAQIKRNTGVFDIILSFQQ